ncbi:MAG: FkbM family methyltransferase [Rhodospirillales bacterium]|nr:FkbM family methyltransferase [Rhodospirillales bacterium]
MTSLNRLRQLYRCVRSFGAPAGVRVWWTLGRPGRGLSVDAARAVRVPGLPHPIWLRPGTSDIANFEQVFLRRAYELDGCPQEAALDAEATRLGPAAVIVDGGANIGLSSIRFAARFPQATVFAVEPAACNLEMIRRNAAGYANIVPVAAALWDRPTTVVIVNPAAEPWQYAVDEAPAATRGALPTVTIDEVIARIPNGEPLIVKLIVEGAEKAIFRAPTPGLARVRHVIFMPNDWARRGGGAGAAAMRALAAQPFDWAVKGLCVFCFRAPS